MVKKALQIAISFSLLVGAYAGYTRLFGIVAALVVEGESSDTTPFGDYFSSSAKTATQLARESFGPSHFAAKKDLKLQYYEASRGYYIYTENYEQKDGNKTVHLWPFALISVSPDGSRKLITSTEAYITMSRPLGMGGSRPGEEPSHIVHARLVGDVRIRDDKGTRDDPADDLRVGPMTSVDYDDKTLQITSDSEIILEDRDLRLTGIGMMIQLRRKVGRASSGDGTGLETDSAFVYNDVHIVVNNVTSNGILPGTARPEKSGKTPLDLRCDREMKIKFPPPPSPTFVGPLDPNREPDPTLAFFKTNVRVIRGTDRPDMLHCDTLDLTLMPNPKVEEEEEYDYGDPPPPTMVATRTEPAKPEAATTADASGTPATPAPSGGPLTDLKLRKAFARGDAVWLQSEASGLVARCLELHYEKHSEEGKPDLTYLNGGTTRKIWIEKVDYDTQSPVPGAIKSITRMNPQDATILDFGPGVNKILARGPGKMEERPSRDASVNRTAWFEDEMEMLTWRDGLNEMPPASVPVMEALRTPRAAIAKGTLRRLVLLKGDPKLVDLNSSTTLDSRATIVAEFQAPLVPLPPAEAKDGKTTKDGPAEIKWLDASVDAHLTAPSRTLTARKFLRAKFETVPAPPRVAAAPANPAAPVVVASNPAPAPPAQAQVPPGSEPEKAPPPVEPAVDGRADRVWANIRLGSSGPKDEKNPQGTKGELKDAQLRGDVMVHQDPEPGKSLGKDASGQALDLISQGEGLMWFAVKSQEPPQASDPRTKLASGVKGRTPKPVAFARVEFEGKIIESEDLIILDQRANKAHAQGAGIYIQMADRGLLDDKGIEGETAPGEKKKSGPSPKDRLVITWNDEMRFYGTSKDLMDRPAGKIEFRGTSREVWTADGRREYRRGVDARMTDSLILCDTMDVYLDRVVNLSKEAKKPAPKATPDGSAQTEAQIAMLDCRGKNVTDPNGVVRVPGVDVVNEKKYPDTGLFKERQRIRGLHVTYDKRTGEFEAPGPGTTYLYKRKNEQTKPDDPAQQQTKAAKKAAPARDATPAKLPPIELTKVTYVDGMRGRFGVAKDSTTDDKYREAVFFGNAQAANQTVDNNISDINFDDNHHREGYYFLTADRIHVFTEPPAIDSKEAARQLLNARGNAAARTVDTLIQADLITFDSASNIIYAYGLDGKEVSFAQQSSPGQPFNTTKYKTVRFNKETHEFDGDNPNIITFVDLKTGIRPKALYPELGGSPKPPELPKPQRLPFQRNSRNSTERKSFNSGQ